MLSSPAITINPLATQLIDWGPAYNPLASKKLFAIALEDTVYLQDVFSREAEAVPGFESPDESNISSLSFDRSGGALLVSQVTGIVSIYDVSTG